MSTKFTDLHCKEVICVSDGRRLGYIADACVEIPTGNVVTIVVPGPCRFFGIFGRQDDYVIPWSRILKMGPDIVLVDVRPEECRRARGKSRLFF